MEQLLNRGTALSDLAYLRILQVIHAQVSLLIEDLKNYELPSMSSRPTEVMDLTRNFTSTGSSTTAVTTMLETAMEELFVPYLEGQRYIERESRSLENLYSNLLTNFTKYHVRPTGCYSSAREKLSSELFRTKLRRGSHQYWTE
jgi:hypothetical protein